MRLVKLMLLLSFSLYCFTAEARQDKKVKVKHHKKEKVKAMKPELTNTNWYLSEVNNLNVGNLAGAKEAYLLMSKGNLSGSTGCNSISGEYDEDRHNMLKFEAITTKMACPDKMTMENMMLSALSQTNMYKINGNHLILYHNSSVLAVFDAMP